MMTLNFGVLARKKDVFLGERCVSKLPETYILNSVKTLYHRRIRDRNCYVGDQPKDLAKVVHNCACTNLDFEWYLSFRLARTWRVLTYSI